MKRHNKFNFAFFGTDQFAVTILETLKDRGLQPTLIITTPDRPRGRKLILTPPPVKIWADDNNVSVIQPEKLSTEYIEINYQSLTEETYDFFLIASYGKIIPEYLLNRPRRGVLNIHPSLLPKYRGPTPIQSIILAGDKKTGVTIMAVDALMDHGPIIAKKIFALPAAITYEALRDKLARIGAELFIEIYPKWLAGQIKTRTQDHNSATYTKKIVKAEGLIRLDDDPNELDRKFRALTPWPGIHFFAGSSGDERKQRVKVTAAELKDGQFRIKKVIPEGRREMTWTNFKKTS